MPSKPVSLGDLHFPKRGDAVAYLNEMLRSYDLGDRVSREDAAILLLALKRHPEASEKVGSGVDSFSVRDGGYGTRCFWVNRTDNTTVKFSVSSCFYGT